MNPRSVDIEQLAWSWSEDPGLEELLVTRTHASGEEIEIPVARIKGTRPGPLMTVMSGMHAGEYSGILAAQKLIREVKADELTGTLQESQCPANLKEQGSRLSQAAARSGSRYPFRTRKSRFTGSS